MDLGLSPLTVTVTTRIIPFLVGNPELNLHLPLLLGRGTIQGGSKKYQCRNLETRQTYQWRILVLVYTGGQVVFVISNQYYVINLRV